MKDLMVLTGLFCIWVVKATYNIAVSKVETNDTIIVILFAITAAIIFNYIAFKNIKKIAAFVDKYPIPIVIGLIACLLIPIILYKSLTHNTPVKDSFFDVILLSAIAASIFNYAANKIVTI